MYEVIILMYESICIRMGPWRSKHDISHLWAQIWQAVHCTIYMCLFGLRYLHLEALSSERLKGVFQVLPPGPCHKRPVVVLFPFFLRIDLAFSSRIPPCDFGSAILCLDLHLLLTLGASHDLSCRWQLLTMCVPFPPFPLSPKPSSSIVMTSTFSNILLSYFSYKCDNWPLVFPVW